MSQRTPLVMGNWKMNQSGVKGVELAGKIRELTQNAKGVDVVVAPPFTALAAIAAELDGSKVELAGQNLYPKPSGAYTGEISGAMLLEAGCKWVILGHSERRQHLKETDEFIREKVRAAFEAGLRPVVCVGELLEEREAFKTLDVVYRQVDSFVAEFESKPGVGVIAYEPVWAIGTGKVAGPEQAQEVHAAIRSRLGKTSAALAQQTRILYGGSMKADNAAGLMRCVDVDGGLVGGASLEAEGFAKIAQAAGEARPAGL